ncbi:MAG: glycosyltransferase family 39 protein [Solirubrobacterales bacterium]|nr:glycosyltransferase family 39 protein [Solirubrobacterales bacterium]MCB0859817.1 glycosyltransferase family 39 protein [Solirubrobacterales bacterium]
MDASRLSKRWIWGLVGTLFLAGLVLRLLMLRESAWGDEMSTLWIIRGNDFFGVISTVNSDAEISPPFFFLLAKVSSWIFGQTPTGIRIPSFVAGVLAVPMFYLVGIRALGRRAALYATAIAAVSPFLVYFSANARAYSVMILLLLAATWCLLAATSENGRTWHWVGWSVAGCLAVYSHYTACLAIAGQLVWVLWFFPALRLRALAFTGLMVLLFLPWIGGFKADLDSPTSDILQAIQGSGFDRKWNAIKDLFFLWIANSKPGFFHRPDMLIGLAGVLVATLAVIVRLARGSLPRPPAERARGVWLAVLMVGSVFVIELLMLAAGTDIFGARNLAPVWAGLPLLIAAGLAAAGPRWGPVALVLVLAGFSVTTARLLDPAKTSISYEKAAESIESDQDRGGAVLDAAIVSPAPLTPLDGYLDTDLREFRMTNIEDRPDFIKDIFRGYDPQQIADQAFDTAGPVRVVTLGEGSAPVRDGQGGYSFLASGTEVLVPAGWREQKRVSFEGVEQLSVSTFVRSGRGSGGGGQKTGDAQ